MDAKEKEPTGPYEPAVIVEEEEALPTAVEMAMRRAERATPATEIKRKRIKPLHEWVLVRRITTGDVLSDGGVLLTAGKERSSVGIVVAVGPKAPIAIGAEVIFTNYALDLEGIEEATGEKDLKLLRFEEVYAELEDLEG
jgi:co-chaperonin GroES (HSP10)